jgi:hypothetical protein
MRATIDLRIGAPDEARDEYIFTDVRGLTLDTADRIIVADHRQNNLRVFTPSGVIIHAFGRRGDGPGDLRQPCCISVAPDGKLWVKEFGNRRYSVFDLRASPPAFLWSVRSTINPIGYTDRVAWDSQGRVVDVEYISLADQRSRAFLRSFLDSSGAAIGRDTLREPPADSVTTVELTVCPTSTSRSGAGPTGCGISVFTQPFGPRALIAFGPNGETARAVTSNYAVTWADVAGRRIALVRRAVSGPQLSQRERQSATQSLETIQERARLSRTRVPFRVPDAKPPIADIGFDLDGRLWVQRSVSQGQPREADVYDRSGRWVAMMEWPANVSLDLWAVRGTTGLGVASDSLGTQQIVRLRFR